MPTAILVHGGAGDVVPGVDPERYREGCLRAVQAGHAILKRGGPAVEAVVAAAMVLEDDPLFNAGVGSSLNAEGDVEMDASLMRGADLGAGAVCAVRFVKNPILLAQRVMERTGHVLLASSGAERFAEECGLERADPSSLITDRVRARWEALRATAVSGSGSGGTIGAVALDSSGHVAAATSTGGTMNKRVGRVGDSPLIGAGTYADDQCGAASGTGLGEAIIKVVMAKLACDRMLAGAHPEAAAVSAVEQLPRAGGTGGIILVDKAGRLGVAFNTKRMSHAWIDAQGVQGFGFLKPGG
jgi:beta-aspartyl-peptidase (threonine type)